jgi:hypothetical protein
MSMNEAKMSVKNELDKVIAKLPQHKQQQVLDFALSLIEPDLTTNTTPTGATGKRGRPKSGRNPYTTTKTVTNSSGKKYRYRVHVTFDAAGKRREKILGRVSV